MSSFGAIVLARFPFTDLSGDKRRPPLVVPAAPNAGDVVVCFITSVPRVGSTVAPILPGFGTGLRQPSDVRFDKLVTLNAAVIAGQIGSASTHWLQANSNRFFAAFGFDPAWIDHSRGPNAG